MQGLAPEVVPSTFAENLSHLEFAADLQQYAAATATEKVGTRQPFSFALIPLRPQRFMSDLFLQIQKTLQIWSFLVPILHS